VAKESGKNQFVGGAFDREHVPSQESAVRHRNHAA